MVVEPGIGWMELNEYLEPYGLFFPLDPGKILILFMLELYTFFYENMFLLYGSLIYEILLKNLLNSTERTSQMRKFLNE